MNKTQKHTATTAVLGERAAGEQAQHRGKGDTSSTQYCGKGKGGYCAVLVLYCFTALPNRIAVLYATVLYCTVLYLSLPSVRQAARPTARLSARLTVRPSDRPTARPKRCTVLYCR